jgi:hypothetical protein
VETTFITAHSWLARTLYRYPHRAFCRTSALVACAVANRRRDDHEGSRRLRYEVMAAARKPGLRVEGDLRNEKISYKVRELAGQGADPFGRRQKGGGRTDRLDPAARFARADGDLPGRGHRAAGGGGNAAGREAGGVERFCGSNALPNELDRLEDLGFASADRLFASDDCGIIVTLLESYLRRL